MVSLHLRTRFLEIGSVVEAMAAHVAGSSEAAHAKAGDHDALVKWLSTETALGRSVLSSMESDGYAVLPGVLTRAECAVELEVRVGPVLQPVHGPVYG